VKVIESEIVGKTGDEGACEDGVFVSDSFAAVIDGATDKSGQKFDGLTGGRFVMEICKSALAELAPEVSAHQAFARLADAVAHHLPANLSPQDRPSAVLAVYSAASREIWQLGDVAYWHAGLKSGGIREVKLSDYFAGGVRAGIICANLAAGAQIADLARNDPGREAILPLLKLQGFFCNQMTDDGWGYGALNGQPIPDRYIHTHSVPDFVDEIILASDGYPAALPKLAESEDRLAQLLAEDPLCIGPLRSTKGMIPGNRSFDDRAYLRIAI
jgi:hypothetical protein